MDAKKMGLIVATAMPPPGKLKRRMDGGDEPEPGEESDDEGADENRGAMAIGDMWDALKRGDKAGAYDAFCDLMNIHRGESSEGEGEKPSSYED